MIDATIYPYLAGGAHFFTLKKGYQLYICKMNLAAMKDIGPFF